MTTALSTAKTSHHNAGPLVRLKLIGGGRVGNTSAALRQCKGLCQVQYLFARSMPSAIMSAQLTGASSPASESLAR